MILSRFSALLFALSCTALSLADDLRLDGGQSGWDKSFWGVQTDNVMGGRSDASVSFEDNSVMVFSGNINLNGGGFTNVRRAVSVDLSSYAGIVVEVEADGWDGRAPLALNLQLGDERGCSYSAPFVVPLAKQIGETASVYLPLEAFDKGGFRQWNCGGKLDMSSIRAMRIYVLYQEGSFEARILSISAVEAPISSTTPAVSFESREDVESLLNASIESGVLTWNNGYKDMCIAIYRSALDSLAASAGFSDTCSGLADFPDYAVGSAAEQTLGFGLRGVIDDVFTALSDEKQNDDMLGLVLDEAMGCSTMSTSFTANSESMCDHHDAIEFFKEEVECDQKCNNADSCEAYQVTPGVGCTLFSGKSTFKSGDKFTDFECWKKKGKKKYTNKICDPRGMISMVKDLKKLGKCRKACKKEGKCKYYMFVDNKNCLLLGKNGKQTKSIEKVMKQFTCHTRQ